MNAIKNNSNLEEIVSAIESEINAFESVIDVSRFRQLQKKLQRFLTTDALTLTSNRWKFEDDMAKQMNLSKKYNKSLCLMMVDIDDFKKINDTFGHNKGDYFLSKVANIIRNILDEKTKGNYYISRWGGEEFLCMIPSKSLTACKKIGNVIRNKVLSSTKISISIGITKMLKEDKYLDFVDRSDSAMYRAKKSGGNKVEIL